jgi:hypothetical protein
MSLQSEIDNIQSKFTTDSLTFTVGELMSLYQQKEIEINTCSHWSTCQKSKFIQSLLLDIPTPSLLFEQLPNDIWRVQDGAQRLITIFEFTGLMPNPFILQDVGLLPSLAYKEWKTEPTSNNSLTQAQRLLIRRSVMQVHVFKSDSIGWINSGYDSYEGKLDAS